jgi:hypothetical protein
VVNVQLSDSHAALWHPGWMKMARSSMGSGGAATS